MEPFRLQHHADEENTPEPDPPTGSPDRRRGGLPAEHLARAGLRAGGQGRAPGHPVGPPHRDSTGGHGGAAGHPDPLTAVPHRNSAGPDYVADSAGLITASTGASSGSRSSRIWPSMAATGPSADSTACAYTRRSWPDWRDRDGWPRSGCHALGRSTWWPTSGADRGAATGHPHRPGSEPGATTPRSAPDSPAAPHGQDPGPESW